MLKIIRNPEHNCLDVKAYFAIEDIEDLDKNTYRSYTVVANMLPFNRAVLLKRLTYSNAFGEVYAEAKERVLDEISFLSSVNFYCQYELE